MTSRKRVLVVEDDVDIRAMIQITLEAEGHEVLLASNGVEGLAQARSGRIDVVLLDLKMPVMDGWEFARRYREARGKAPIVVLSAAQDAERQARDLGARHTLTKPFDLDSLISVVASVTA